MSYEIDEATGCWNWVGSIAPNGYGVARTQGRGSMTAHRLVFMESGGSIPDGMELDHLCRNRRCVNPAHLEPVTHAENMLRAFAAAPRPAVCKLGHPLDGVRTREGGGRYCKQCNVLSKQKQRASKD